MKRAYQIMMTGLALVMASATAQAADINVSPIDNLQAKVNAANDGDRLLLAPGTYNQTFFINGKSITIEGTGGAGSTTLTAQLLNDTVIRVLDAPSPGVTLRGLTIMDGVATGGAGNAYPFDGGGVSSFGGDLTVEDCFFTGNHSNDDGGALYCTGTLVVERTTFEMNTASDVGAAVLVIGTMTSTDCDYLTNASGGRGAAVYLVSGATYDFTRSTFTGNESITQGGGVALINGSASFDQCSFTSNYAVIQGGAIFSLTTGGLTCLNTTFTGNFVDRDDSDGGALMCSATTTSLFDCTFTRNSSLDDGGAILQFNGGRLDMDRCRFYGNTGERGGAAKFIAGSSRSAGSADNCLFVGNTALPSGFGGALYAAPNSSAVNTTFRNCTFFGNQGAESIMASSPSGTGSSKFFNCVAWGNSNVDTAINPGHQVTYCDVERTSGTHAGTGNINTLPSFVELPNPGVDLIWGTADDFYGDLHLLDGSAGIDAGDSPVALDLTGDFDGANRNVDDPATANTGVSAWALNIDMGAFEFQPKGAVSTCQSDANGDNQVDLDDLQLLLFNFGTSCP